MLHQFYDGTEFDLRRQTDELLMTSSRAAATTLAENYVGTRLTRSNCKRA